MIIKTFSLRKIEIFPLSNKNFLISAAYTLGLSHRSLQSGGIDEEISDTQSTKLILIVFLHVGSCAKKKILNCSWKEL